MISVIGAGGHGQVVADILELSGEVYRFYDDSLPQYPPIEAATGKIIIAIGNNSVRKLYFKRTNAVNAIHPSAIIASTVKIGKGVVICAGVIINAYSEIGDNVILNTGCSIDHHNVIGKHAHIAPNATLCGAVTVGKGTLVGANATIVPGRTVPSWSLVKAGSLYK